MSEPPSSRVRGRTFALVAARDVETWSRERALQRLREFASEWPGRDALLRLSDSLMGPDEDIDRAIAFLADRFESGRVVAVRLRDDALVGARPNVLGAIDWDNIPMLSELSAVGDWVGGVDAPSRPAPSPAQVPTPEPLPPKPAEEAELQPTLLRLELGALGFAERCVLLVPRPGAGLWHPWAALTTVANHLKENPGDRLVAVGHHESESPRTTDDCVRPRSRTSSWASARHGSRSRRSGAAYATRRSTSRTCVTRGAGRFRRCRSPTRPTPRQCRSSSRSSTPTYNTRPECVDLVIVPEQEAGKIDLGQGPSGVYDVAAIQTLALGAVVAPRRGMSIEIATSAPENRWKATIREGNDTFAPRYAYWLEKPSKTVTEQYGNPRIDPKHVLALLRLRPEFL